MIRGSIEGQPLRCVFRNVDTGSDIDMAPEPGVILRTVFLHGADGWLMVIEYRQDSDREVARLLEEAIG